MRLTTKLSALISLLSLFTISLVLVACIASYFWFSKQLVERRVDILTREVDRDWVTYPADHITDWLQRIMPIIGIEQLQLVDSGNKIIDLKGESWQTLQERPDNFDHYINRLAHSPNVSLHLFILNPAKTWASSFTRTYLLIIGGIIITLVGGLLIAIYNWFAWQWRCFERLCGRAQRILSGDYFCAGEETLATWPAKIGHAITLLQNKIEEAGEQRLRIDRLIRVLATQDSETGLNNRLFFDSQLATLLDDAENRDIHGVIMMVSVVGIDSLVPPGAQAGRNLLNDYLFDLANLLSTFTLRYPKALLARYFHSNFTILLPYSTLKEAHSMAEQLIRSISALTPMPGVNRDDMLHIGISRWYSGMTVHDVIENVEMATRRASLVGGNSWISDETEQEGNRGSVRWRTLLERTLCSGGPCLYQRPVLLEKGKIHHRQIIPRILDGDKEVVADEYMHFITQLGLADRWDSQLIERVIVLLKAWPHETLALPITISSLTSKRFQRWLKYVLLTCTKAERARLLFELAEAEVCQHIEQLAPAVALLRKFACRIAVIQAGLTVVSSAYIRYLGIELIKLDSGLVHNIELRQENQLFVRSLLEVCTASSTRLVAVSVRTSREWQILTNLGVTGGQGDYFSPAYPVKITQLTEHKKISP